MRATTLFVLIFVVIGCASTRPAPPDGHLALEGEMIHACECDRYCPCPFERDGTYSQCRSLTVWMIDSGASGETKLDGVTFAVSMTKAGKNVAKAKGTWEGILLLPEEATPAQREMISTFVQQEHGEGFAKLDVRVVPTTLERSRGSYNLVMGSVVELRTRALVGADGTVTRIEDPPSHPMGMGTLNSGVAEVHRYDDGATRWDFAGRNAYFGPFRHEN